MKALIVDDDRVLTDVLAFTLRREGFEIVLAHDGESALRRFAEETPDLVLLDVNMPRLDGFAVCRRIRQQSDTPIILLTVRGEEDDIVRGLELGADDYMTKPFSPTPVGGARPSRAAPQPRRPGRCNRWRPTRRQPGVRCQPP
jgi:DNA-binding response OmpR family regulator